MSNKLLLTLSDGTTHEISEHSGFEVTYDTDDDELELYATEIKDLVLSHLATLRDQKIEEENNRAKTRRVFSNFTKMSQPTPKADNSQTSFDMNSSIASKKTFSSFNQPASAPSSVEPHQLTLDAIKSSLEDWSLTSVINSLVKMNLAQKSFGDLYALGTYRYTYTIGDEYWESPFGTDGADPTSLLNELIQRVWFYDEAQTEAFYRDLWNAL